MKNIELIKRVVEYGTHGGDGYFEAAHLVAVLLPKSLHEQLTQLVNGPIEDGDIISKSCRHDLFEVGLAIRVCHKGEQGYTGATYFAFSVLKAWNDVIAGRKGA